MMLPCPDSEYHTVPLFLPSVASECTTERWGFQRPESRLRVRVGRVRVDDDDSAHEPEAVGGRMIGYCRASPLLSTGCRLALAGFEGTRLVFGVEEADKMGGAEYPDDPCDTSSLDLFELGLDE